jgi:hypothetical protein
MLLIVAPGSKRWGAIDGNGKEEDTASWEALEWLLLAAACIQAA